MQKRMIAVPLFGFLVLGLLADGVGQCLTPPAIKPTVYQTHDSLQETLLATRLAYQDWLRTQPTARKMVEWGPWSSTSIRPAAEVDALVKSKDRVDLNRVGLDGQRVWTKREDVVDGKPVSIAGGTSGSALFLTRTVSSSTDVELTVGIGGGSQLSIWLNGGEIASAHTELFTGRYGCSIRTDGTRIDQLLIDLPLRAGQNSLVVRIATGSEPSFYFSASPNPIPRLWALIRVNFPSSRNSLLETVPAKWFSVDGWLGRQDTELEQQLIDSISLQCGDHRTLMIATKDRLKASHATHDDRRWLDLCGNISTWARLCKELTNLQNAVVELSRCFPNAFLADDVTEQIDEASTRLSELAGDWLNQNSRKSQELSERLDRMRSELLVHRNPLLQDKEVLFVKRYTYNSKHYYDDFQHISRWGGNLCALSLNDGRVREVVPALAGGVFDRYDLSYDAKKIVFGYRRPMREGFRIYEVGADGDGLKQVTCPPADEVDRMAAYGKTSTGDAFYGLLGYRFWTDDVHPCYLPDGGLCFASTRSEHGVLCTPNHYLACTNLYRINNDGTGMRPISSGALSEFTPTMMEDGRVLYCRWEYVYKGIAAVQSLWTVRPDGSGGEEFFGDNITNPGVLWQARQVPGHPEMAVCTGCGHEPLGVGQALLLNMHKNKRTTEPITSLTPNVRTESLRGLYQLRNGEWREDVFGPFYADPYPLSDKFFLVACNPTGRYNDPAGYGIHLIDAFGNRVKVFDDPEISCWQPMLLQPRETPTTIPSVADEVEKAEPTATLFLSDVYQGLDGVERGTVKYLRVIEQVAKPWSAEVDRLRNEDRRADGFGGHLVVSHNKHIWIAVLHGVVPVESDGSAWFQVPAGRNLFFQALDEDYMEVQRMRTFINMEPGETRSCIGCHEHRMQAPEPTVTLALRKSPRPLEAQPGEAAPRPLHYPTDVQPILDRHCVECHDGTDGSSKPNLQGELTTLFNRSYESILQAGLVNAVQEWDGIGPAMGNAPAVPPYTFGAHRSRIVDLLREGHYETKLSKQEWTRLVTWIDCGSPYYGSYFGRRNLRYRGQPDFRPVPTVNSACGVCPDFAIPKTPEPLPTELLAWWRLGQPSADDSVDKSGNAHSARIVGTAVGEWTDHSGMRQFDGNDFIEAVALGKQSGVSVALWLRADSLGNRWNPLLFCNGGQAGAIHFSLLDDGSPNVAVNTGDWNWTHCQASRPLSCGSWHHVVLVCDGRLGGRVRFFIDGKLAGDEYLGVGIPLDLYRFRLGAWDRWETQPSNNFHGAIADVRVYSGTLSDQQVAELAGEK